MAVLGAMAPKHDADFVFVDVTNSSGWSNQGVSWLIGLLSTVYPFLGYDAACHLAEEMPRPERNVPIAMVGSVVVNGIMGFGYAIMLLFSLGDLEGLLTSATGFPFMQLFLNVTQNKGGATVLILMPTLIAVAGTLSTMFPPGLGVLSFSKDRGRPFQETFADIVITANAAGCTSTSRTFWAFARDSATPYSKYFSHVNTSLQVPVRAVVLVTICEMLLGFIYLGSTTAFNAILSMAIIGMYTSYLLPIVYMSLYGRRKLVGKFGPFKLGNVFGPITNVAAICWLVVAIVFSTFPTLQPVTPQNMNYAIAVMGGWLLAGVVFYFIAGKGKYAGPIL